MNIFLTKLSLFSRTKRGNQMKKNKKTGDTEGLEPPTDVKTHRFTN